MNSGAGRIAWDSKRGDGLGCGAAWGRGLIDGLGFGQGWGFGVFFSGKNGHGQALMPCGAMPEGFVCRE